LDFGRRRAYTLIELLLVLAIIVIAAAAVAPSLRGTMRNSAVKSAASTVRAELTRAHVMAMRTGRIHMFQYELGGTKYKIEPYIGPDDALESKDGEAGSMAPPAAHNQQAKEPTLAEGTKFVMGDAAMESRAQRVEEEIMGMGGSGATWSRPILFYPDGSSSDAFIIVGNDFNAGIRVDLRGLTAAAKIGELSDLRKLESEQSMSR
jgi:prepilin-type N-terminal cleavage/methylation domain-containing protein